MNTLTEHELPHDSRNSEHEAADGWTNSGELDQSDIAIDRASEVGDSISARADEFVRSIGALDLDTLRAHHLELAMAVIELAADAGAPLPWGHDDPTVALLRAAAKLALTSPEATSSAAADLLASIASTDSRTS